MTELLPSRRAILAGITASTLLAPVATPALEKDQTMSTQLSTKLLTPETSVVMLLDYQQHVMDGIGSTDQELIELNARALARASKAFNVPVLLSTIGVKLRGDHPTLPSVRAELADEPEYDRNTMNAWEDDTFHRAVSDTGRRRLIFAGVWSEVCLLYPVLHAQREGFETYFVTDAVGGSTVLAQETAFERMIQAGSQPITVASMLTEWIRDWGSTPYGQQAATYFEWYRPEIERVRTRLRATPHQATMA